MKRFEDLFEASSAQLMAAGARRATAAAAQQRRMKVAKSSVAANQTINAIKSQAAKDAATTPISKGGPLALRTPAAKQRDPKVAAALKNVPVNKNAPATKAQKQFQTNKDFGTTAQTSASTAANKDTLAAKADRKSALQNRANELKKQQAQGQDRLSRIRSAVNSMAPKNKISSTQSDASAFGAMLGNIGNAARGAGRAIAAGTGLDKKLEAKRNQVASKLFGGPKRPGLSTGVRSSGVSNPSRKPADPWASSNKPADPWKSSPQMSNSAKKILNPSAGSPGNTGTRSSNTSFVNKNKPKPATPPTTSALKLRRDPSMFKSTGTSKSGTGLGAAARKNPALRSQLIKQRMGEEYSNWREEFIFEVEKRIPAEKKKTIEPMSGSNQIIVNPTVDQIMKEAVLGRYPEDRGGGKKLRPASERTKPKPEPKESKPQGPKVTILKRKGPRKGEATASQVQGWRGSDRTNTNRAGHRAHAKTISADFEPQGQIVNESEDCGCGMKKRVPTEQEIAKEHKVSVEYVVKQAEIGSTVEREHTKSHEEAYGIALQHIMEFPDYYKHLLPMENQLKKEWKKKDPVKEDHIPIAMGKMLDSEGGMIKNQLETIERSVELLRAQIKSNDMQIPAWVQAKVTLATENILTCANYMAGKDEEVKEEKKPGLWANIHARRKAGLPRKKPGENGYPKTLDIEEGLKQARRNVGASRCWDNKKVDPNKPTKMKGGTEVPNCVPEGFVDPEHGEAPSGRSPLSNVSDHPNPKVRKKAVKAFKTQMSREYGGHWKSRSSDPNVDESHVPGQPAERLGAVTAIPQKERDAARERTLAKAKEMREKNKKNIREKIDVGADAGATISDFVHSRDSRFAGDSKKQRIKRALGAYYGARKEEFEIEEEKREPDLDKMKRQENRHRENAVNQRGGSRGDNKNRASKIGDVSDALRRGEDPRADTYGGAQKKPVDHRASFSKNPLNNPPRRVKEPGVKKEEFEIEEGMTIKDFKQQRSRQKRRDKRAADEIAPGRRAGIHDDKASPERAARHRANVDPDFEGNDERNYPGGRLRPKKVRKARAVGELTTEAKTAAWQRKEGKNPEGGLNERGRKSYEEDNPGSDLKPPQPEGGPRQRSFCARMSGMPGPMKDENGKPTRKALSLRKWHCGRKGG